MATRKQSAASGTDKPASVAKAAAKPLPAAPVPNGVAAPVAAKAPAAKKAPAPRKASVTPAPAPAEAKKLAAKKPAVARKAPAATKAPAKPAPASPPIDPAQRANYIEVAAFYIAERRGFAPGNPEQDYLDAAAEIDRMIAAGHFAR